MKIAISFILSLLIALSLLYLLVSALGISFGVRVGGNIFSDGLSFVRAGYLVPVMLLACVGLHFIWRGRRSS